VDLRAALLERCQTIDRLVKERDYERDQNAVLCQRAVAFDAHMTRENIALRDRLAAAEKRVEKLEDAIMHQRCVEYVTGEIEDLGFDILSRRIARDVSAIRDKEKE
jgi:hypothetical protein